MSEIARRVFIEGLGATLVGFWNNDKATHTPDGLAIEEVAGDRPAFRRIYKVTINNSVSMKITIRNSYRGTYINGELDQTGGKWVLFDPESPADKILDREILPTVQKYCAQILEVDKTFRRSNPGEFVDESGAKWRRVASS